MKRSGSQLTAVMKSDQKFVAKEGASLTAQVLGSHCMEAHSAHWPVPPEPPVVLLLVVGPECPDGGNDLSYRGGLVTLR